MHVSATRETRQERDEVGNVGVTIAPQTDLLRENQDVPARSAVLNTGSITQSNGLVPNEENVTIIPPVPIRRARSSLHADDVVLPSVSQRSSANVEFSRRSQDIEGISSIRPVDRSITSGIRQIVLDDRGSGGPSYQHEGILLSRTSTAIRRDSSDSDDNVQFRRGRGYANKRGRPPERERYPSRDRQPPRRRVPSSGRPPK